LSAFQVNKLTQNIGAEIIGKNIFDNLTTKEKKNEFNSNFRKINFI